MRSILKPHLFISYSRHDLAYTSSLSEELKRRGFSVFLDTSGIDPGENFVNRLSTELRRATAIVAVLSDHYTKSRWAQAELYLAAAMRKVIIPVVIPPASLATLDEPLERLLRDTQFVSPDTNASGSASLGGLLQRARNRYRRQIVRRAGLVALPALFLVGLAWASVSTLNAREAKVRRNTVEVEVMQATQVLPKGRIQALADQVRGDRTALGEMQLIAADRTKATAARFNALVLSGELLKSYRQWRWDVEELDLRGVEIDGSPIVDVTFRGGRWNDVLFRDLTFSGVVWPSGLDFSMSAVVFNGVNFNASLMDSIKAIDVSFVNTKFRGSEVNITNFAKVRFVTEQPQESGTPTITQAFTMFERSTLISGHTPPEAGVLDMREPEDGVIFQEVMFRDCRLEGWFDPNWFRNSTFERCILPAGLKEALQESGNFVNDQ